MKRKGKNGNREREEDARENRERLKMITRVEIWGTTERMI